MAQPFIPAGCKNTNQLAFMCSDETLKEALHLLSVINQRIAAGRPSEFLIEDEQFCFDPNDGHTLDSIRVNSYTLEEFREEQAKAGHAAYYPRPTQKPKSTDDAG